MNLQPWEQSLDLKSDTLLYAHMHAQSKWIMARLISIYIFVFSCVGVCMYMIVCMYVSMCLYVYVCVSAPSQLYI